MNIFYFNITYACNSNCIFCYSHNTIHSGGIYNEIAPDVFMKYLQERNIQRSDRVILNGGEPFIHSNIVSILKILEDIGCEVLIYTNGRCLQNLDLSFITENFRFVIPIHGHKTLHDKITRCEGSFFEMAEGLRYLDELNCKVDIKLILNPYMISNIDEFQKTIQDIDSIPFNNALHITQMADTIISKQNGIPSVSDLDTAKLNRILFNHYRNKNIVLRFFDTCIKDMPVESIIDSAPLIKVYFKDVKAQWEYKLYTPEKHCRSKCPKSEFCQSAVGNYTVLEYNKIFFKGLE